MAKHKVYQFYSELEDFDSKIWRRFEINGEKKMSDLSYAIMAMYQASGGHLFYLDQNVEDESQKNQGVFPKNKHYEFSAPDSDLEGFGMPNEVKISPEKMTINKAGLKVGDTLDFLYDFGDGWHIQLTLEEIYTEEISLRLLPRVLEGAGYGIIEDIGGVYGLSEFVKALEKGSGTDYEEYMEWFGGNSFDFNQFDEEETNDTIKSEMRYFKDMYEENPMY
ncbi:MAG TPA: plasmid pRiA4b ORF-3 family protein [Candidatus Tetragenococcus pullicola]|nr:plasmid pRiA4b ORF-3 family protein [Candidatus Tetragenococcus pullicola]